MKIPWVSNWVASRAPGTPFTPPSLIAIWPNSTTSRWVFWTEPGLTALADEVAVQRPPIDVSAVFAQLAVNGKSMSWTVAASFRPGPL